MSSDEPTIIPFGKHRGKTIAEVQEFDPGYLDWLTGQPWFRDKYVILHQTIINRGAEPEDTPDHNALQALFLDNDFCGALATAAGLDPQYCWQYIVNEGIARVKDRLLRDLAAIDSGKAMWDREQREKDVATNRQELARLQSLSFKLHVESREFEVGGFDVVFWIRHCDRFHVEIKPVVADDYPSVLRQMKLAKLRASGVVVLFLERYIGVGATRDQFIAIFKSAGIRVVFREDVDGR